MSDFDIDGARKAGYSDAEITDYLGKQQNFDVGGARKSGYSDTEILSHLSPPKAEPAPREPVTASAVFQGRPMSLPAAKIEPSSPQKPEPAALPWSDLPGNVPGSAGKFVNTLAQAFLHPVDTYSGLVRTAEGMVKPPDFLGKETPEQTAARVAPANAAGQYFSDRFSTPRRVRNTIISDPVGFAADASVPLTMGGGALARAPGIAGKVGEIAQTAGRLADPITAAGKTAGAVVDKVVEPVVSNALGMTTGAGTSSVRAAAKAGAEGGENAEAFRGAIRGETSINDTVDTAKAALDQVRADRAKAYKAGMADVSKDKDILDFAPIDKAVTDATDVGTFKGLTIEPAARAVVSDMKNAVTAWRRLDPAAFHTAEGIDALKRTLGNIRDSTEQYTPARVAADRIYRAVRAQIVDQVPEYAKTMGAYGKASDNLDEVTKTLSLGEKATGETAGRKLLSVTRNGANTNYGQRMKLVDQLAEHEPTLPFEIAGHAMNALAPQGLVGRGGAMGVAGSIIANPANALAVPLFSPRVVGEAAHLGGRVVGGAQRGGKALGITADRLRQLEQLGYQAGNINALAR